MGGTAAAGDRGALSSLRVGRGRRVRAASPGQRREAGKAVGGEVGRGAMPACGVAPPAGGIPGDVDADFHHQIGFHQRDDQLFRAAPPGARIRHTMDAVFRWLFDTASDQTPINPVLFLWLSRRGEPLDEGC